MAERRVLQRIGAPKRVMMGGVIGRHVGKRPGKEEAVKTVTVACKLPNGLVLQLFEWIDVPQPGPGGIRMVKESVRVGQRYIVRGNRFAYGQIPDFRITDNNNGYGLTQHIPRDFWDKWIEQNKDADYVKSKLIFAHARQVDTIAEAYENQKRKSGLEPIDPAKPPVRQVGTDEELAARMNINVKEPTPISRGISNAA